MKTIERFKDRAELKQIEKDGLIMVNQPNKTGAHVGETMEELVSFMKQQAKRFIVRDGKIFRGRFSATIETRHETFKVFLPSDGTSEEAQMDTLEDHLN